MGESTSDEVLQFIQAVGQKEVEQYRLEEDDTLLAAISTLVPTDTRDLIRTMAGFRPLDQNFYARMKEKGWHFESDTTDPSQSGIYGHGEHGSPRIGSVVEFPGGSFGVRLHDLIRAIGSVERVQNLFHQKRAQDLTD